LVNSAENSAVIAMGGVWYDAGSQKNSGNNPALMPNATRALC
jgi:hypothetical protein